MKQIFAMLKNDVRRKDRLWDLHEADELLTKGEFGFLSLVDENEAYGIPISYAREGGNIYFHCAFEGRKISAIKKNSSACFVVVGNTKVRPSEFTTSYQSVMAQGKIALVEDEEERRSALRLLIKKYSPDFSEVGEKYINSSFHRTAVLRFEIACISAKHKGEKKMK